MEKRQRYSQWRNKILGLVTGICQQCSDPRKQKTSLDYDHPLNCSCRCPYIEGPLSRAAAIDKDLKSHWPEKGTAKTHV